jgi:MauM/NapG family ferredoxin protein
MTLRRTNQLLFLALFFFLTAFPSWSSTHLLPPETFLLIDSMTCVSSMISARMWITGAGIGLLVLLLSGLLGRFFCGWVCPLGTCIDLADEWTANSENRRWNDTNRRVRGLKYDLLIFILASAVFSQNLAYLLDPIVLMTGTCVFAVFPAASGAMEEILGTLQPVFEALDLPGPARMEIGLRAFPIMGIVSLLFLALVLWLSRYQRRFWCRAVCPLGALLALPSRFSPFKYVAGSGGEVNANNARHCPMGAILDAGMAHDPCECVRCGACASIRISAGARKALPIDLSRRRAMSAVGAGAITAAWMAFNPARLSPNDHAVRPPGSLPEGLFLATCARCGLCVRACPTDCLQTSFSEVGISGLMTPVAVMRIGACDQECISCGAACPTGAIRRLDLEEKLAAKMGNAVITPGRCLAWEQGRPCLVCDEQCPYGAIYWKVSEAGFKVPYVDENRCNGCGRCEKACPVDGSAAIRIFPAGQIRLKTGSYISAASEHSQTRRDRHRGIEQGR